MAITTRATSKACSACGEVKALADFSPQACGLHGRMARCKTCRNAEAKSPAPPSRPIPAQPARQPSSVRESWREHAACQGADPELFYTREEGTSAKAQRETEAKAYCNRCPVKGACLSWALRTGEPWGIWGGTNEDERRKLARGAAA